MTTQGPDLPDVTIDVAPLVDPFASCPYCTGPTAVLSESTQYHCVDCLDTGYADPEAATYCYYCRKVATQYVNETHPTHIIRVEGRLWRAHGSCLDDERRSHDSNQDPDLQ